MGYLHARQPSENFAFIKDLHRSALDQGFGLARWVMASLLLVHGGALVALVGSAEKHPAVVSAGAYFVWGALLALTTGIATWFNFNLVAEAASERLDWVKLEAQDVKSADRYDVAARCFSLVAIICAFSSLALFGVGANRAGQALTKSVQAAAPVPPPCAPRSALPGCGSRPH